MSNYFDAFHGIDFHGNSAVNFKPESVATLPLSPFEGQTVYLTTTDGSHMGKMSYQWSGTEWNTITHHDLTVKAGSTDYLDITDYELSVKALLAHDYVYDNTSLSLSAWITSSGYDGTQYQAGDEFYFDASTDGAKAYKHNGGTTGTTTDFFLIRDALTDAEIRSKFTDGEATSYISADGSFDVLHDHSTISINGSNELYVVDSAIATAKLANDSVTRDKINPDVAGIGLIQNVDGSLEVNVDGTTIIKTGDLIKIQDSYLANIIAGDGISYNATTENLDVNPDNSTIEVVADAVQIKDLGVTEAKLATAVTTKLNDSYVEAIGDNSATTFTVTHTLGTRNLIISIADTIDGYKEIASASLDCRRPSDNTITLDFGATVPSTDQFLVVIKKAV